MKKINFFVLTAFLVLFPVVSAAFTITDDSTGGDCSAIALWDGSIKTCTLTTDITDSINITSDNITLDGGGRKITGPSYATGIVLSDPYDSSHRPSGVKLTNLTLDGWGIGINVNAGTNTLIENNVLTNILGTGIFGSNATYVSDLIPYSVTIRGNTFEAVSSAIGLDGYPINVHIEANSIHVPLNGQGIFIYGGRGGIFEKVTIHGNTVDSPGTNSNTGITFDRAMSPFGIPYPCFRPTISFDIVVDISGNTVKGFDRGINFSTNCTDVLSVIHDNILNNNTTGLNFFIPNQPGIAVVSRNDFINNVRSILPDHITSETSTISAPLPEGGNYWSDYDEESEGCVDVDQDGFCDSQYVSSAMTTDPYFGNVIGPISLVDEHPYTKPIHAGAPFSAWKKLTGPWSGDCDSTFGTVAIHPDKPSTVYIGSSHPTNGCGLYKSVDGGQTWVSINIGFPQIGLPPFEHYPLVSEIAVAPSNPNIVYVGTFVDNPIAPYGRVYRSRNGGGEWVSAGGKVSRILRQPQINKPVLDIAVDPKKPNIAYVGLVRDGVFKTTNSGGAWRKIRSGTVAIGATDYFSLVKVAPSNPDVVYVSGFTHFSGPSLPCSFTIGECVEVNGVLPLAAVKSIDGGRNWTSVNNPTPVTFNNLGALITDLAIDSSDHNLLYASTIAYLTPLPIFYISVDNKGVFKSSDGGMIWEAINHAADVDLAQFPIYRVIIELGTPNNLYAVAGFNGIFKSTDGGNNWERILMLGLPSSTFIANLSLAGPHLYALTSNGIYVLDNSGGNP